MLEELRVKNYALIDDISVRFGTGFNVLTGETGAGKSILIDALSLILGGKGRSEGVRQGAEEAEVIALFQISESVELKQWCDRYGIAPEENSLLIRRTLRTNGRGSSSVQAVPVPRIALAELAGFQVDLHGQHEHQSLFQTASHRRLLDRFSGLETRVNAFTRKFSELANLEKRINELGRNNEQAIRDAEFLRYALVEIESAELERDEEECLNRRQNILAQHEELTSSLENAFDAGAESRNGALTLLRKTGDGLNSALRIDASLGRLVERFDAVFYEIEDIVNDIRLRREQIEFDPAELEHIDDRLGRIKTLETKYKAATVAEVLIYADTIRDRLKRLDQREDETRLLMEERKKLQAYLVSEASILSRERESGAELLQHRVEEHLKALGMPNAWFTVSLASKRGDQGRSVMGAYGTDDIEFLLSANQGEQPRPLTSAASGGELSRVMLALKTVLIESDPVPTLVFDEVDTGIGGEIARSVGEHLFELSHNKQVFCVTHLATIAVFADNHIQIMKEVVNDRTVTKIRTVAGVERVQEVARMLAGDREDSTSLDHALRMLNIQGWCTDISAIGSQ